VLEFPQLVHLSCVCSGSLPRSGGSIPLHHSAGTFTQTPQNKPQKVDPTPHINPSNPSGRTIHPSPLQSKPPAGRPRRQTKPAAIPSLLFISGPFRFVHSFKSGRVHSSAKQPASANVCLTSALPRLLSRPLSVFPSLPTHTPLSLINLFGPQTFLSLVGIRHPQLRVDELS
jgi:hypothetical protein